MSLLSQTKEICQYLSIRPQKRFGQNFLIEKNTLAKIIRLAKIAPGDLVLEIGTGFGFLTKALANEASFVITVEADKKILKFLASELKNLPNVELIEGDILNEKTQEKLRNLLFKKDYKVVANIPYQITSSLIRFFLTEINPPKQLILMVQKEVAKRLIARPPQMNLLALSVNFYAQVEILSFISRNNFWPRPKVDSTLIKITLRDFYRCHSEGVARSHAGGRSALAEISRESKRPANMGRPAASREILPLPLRSTQSQGQDDKEEKWLQDDKLNNFLYIDEEDFFKIIKIGFSHKRKKLIGNLAGDLKIEKEKLIRIFSRLGWKEDLRAENLSLEEWVELLSQISNKNY